MSCVGAGISGLWQSCYGFEKVSRAPTDTARRVTTAARPRPRTSTQLGAQAWFTNEPVMYSSRPTSASLPGGAAPETLSKVVQGQDGAGPSPLDAAASRPSADARVSVSSHPDPSPAPGRKPATSQAPVPACTGAPAHSPRNPLPAVGSASSAPQPPSGQGAGCADCGTGSLAWPVAAPGLGAGAAGWAALSPPLASDDAARGQASDPTLLSAGAACPAPAPSLSPSLSGEGLLGPPPGSSRLSHWASACCAPSSARLG